MSSYQVVIQGSALLGFWGAYAANASITDTSDWQWQIPVAIQLIPGAILLLGTLYVKETPHFLAAVDRLDEIEETVAWLRDLPTSDARVQQESREISTTVLAGIRKQKSHHNPFLRQALSNPIRKRLLTGVGLFIAQNLSGVRVDPKHFYQAEVANNRRQMNALNYYVAIIFMTAGFKTVSSSLLLTGIFGLAKLVAALLFMFVCVRINGNRFWLLWGTGICAVSMFVLGYCVATMPTSGDSESFTAGNVRAVSSVLSVYV
jgi:hypothetical protein